MISEIIESRRAVFPAQYNSEPISKEEIKKILDAANWAPTHKRTEPWRFKVFHGEAQRKLGEFLAGKFKETTANFAEINYNNLKANPVKAGCVIAICMQRDPKESVPEWEEIASTAMAVQNMWLTAHAMKIGGYWSSPGLMKFMNELIEMKEGERCLGFFYLGKYDADLPEGIRKTPIEEKTEWI